MLSTGAKSPIAPGRGNGVAKPQHCSPRFAALHKFKLMPGPPVLHPVLREASPRVFLDVSSLNLAAFRSPIFLRNPWRLARQNYQSTGSSETPSAPPRRQPDKKECLEGRGLTAGRTLSTPRMPPGRKRNPRPGANNGSGVAVPAVCGRRDALGEGGRGTEDAPDPRTCRRRAPARLSPHGTGRRRGRKKPRRE